MQDTFDKYLPWFILREIPHVGNALIKRLVDHLGSARRVLTASSKELTAIDRVGERTARQILAHKKVLDVAKKELERTLSSGANIIALSDQKYPLLLRAIPDPPPVLTYFGEPDNQAPSISIVGSRQSTRYGENTARKLAFDLSSSGFQIVSGMARGIDTMAHKGALEAGKKTIAVMGSGLNKIYPKENLPLFKQIRSTGTVYSEFKVDTHPAPANFPVRNRIIAGLSCGTIVVEAARKSGSLITARLAAEYNREVFSIPGSIFSAKSQGAHALLKQGAKLVENQTDVIEELGHFVHCQDAKRPATAVPQSRQHLSSDHCTTHQIMDYLDPYPVHIDTLIQKSGMDSASVASQLLDLELTGKINRHKGNYYSISEDYH